MAEPEHNPEEHSHSALGGLDTMRHSTAHIMAEAVLKLFPEAKTGIGPTIEHGFYYDFDLPRSLTPEDLKVIEENMKEIISSDSPFSYEDVDKETALKTFAHQPYKAELIRDIPEDKVRIYRQGSFVDLCRGPHVSSTGEIGAFKLLNVAGAYWRGDESRPMLQRIYGAAFETSEELERHLAWLEEVERRDHRTLGKALDLFSIHPDLGGGLVLWHPKLALVRAIVEDFWRQEHLKRGYQPVYTPHIGRSWLWETSGHLDFYQESMYSPMDIDQQNYYIKPMNCPFHILIYRSDLRSYRELPMRLSELGTVYRYERAGVLHGLMRVRGFTQDDSHIFCRLDQVEGEIQGVLDLAIHFLGTFGFKEYNIYLSTRPDKYSGSLDDWGKATEALRRAVEEKGLPYQVDEGGGVFYGPKIDIKIKDAIGREWQCSTIQFDFNLPERFDLTFVGEDGREHRPFMVHRALLGSMERFFGSLIEHYAGAFPVWLAPVQAVIIPIADRHLDYAHQVEGQLMEAGFRAQVDERSERMNYKIRQAQVEKVPFMLIVGDREQASGAVSVRLRSGEDMGGQSVASLIALMKQEVEERT